MISAIRTRGARLLMLPTPPPTTPASGHTAPLPTPPVATPVAKATTTMVAPPPPLVATPITLPTLSPAEVVATPFPQPLPTLPPPQATLPPELGLRGETWTVLFTPGGVSGSEAAADLFVANLIDYIDAAQTSIHLAVYEMDLTPVAEALVRAHERGVDVRFVTDNEAGLGSDSDEGHGQFALLRGAGIEVQTDTRSALMHNKFIIIDNAIFITGSTNLTVNDVYENNNNIVVSYLPEVAAIYEREFEEMWAGQFGPKSPSQAGQAVIAVNGQPFIVLFAPEDEPFDTLVRLVSAAESSIRFMAFSFTNDALGLAMQERFEAGVDVAGIFEVRGSETAYAELPRLYCAGVPVRQDGNPQTFHHKVVVIDNYVVITGSMNFSDSAADDNDENMVAISEPLVAELYLQEFERRWAEATLPHPEDMNCP
jgi:phosphatidylserine/phosphatidylglycerophosphate/cardiolipin synthase-like enzyme